uniref:Reverse transcriptase domain-containing protein n=1 Tax=Tanacetum cinerariifolium TaxID=118510 RepID=A0A6L2K505_TANCI|nr:reverse transcriptase domain-containing protein [Tanacetum cinerariifolium]
MSSDDVGTGARPEGAESEGHELFLSGRSPKSAKIYINKLLPCIIVKGAQQSEQRVSGAFELQRRGRPNPGSGCGIRIEIADADLKKPFKETVKTPLTQRIIEFVGPEFKMPTNIKLYGGTGDPKDNLSRLTSAANSGEWPMPVWCRMFQKTLDGSSRGCLQTLNPMDDEPMWVVDRVVALTPGSVITIPDTNNEFAIKVIQVKQKQLNLGVGTERMIFHIDSSMKHSYSNDCTCFSIDVIGEILEEDFDALLDEGSEVSYSIKGTIIKEKLFAKFDEFMAMTTDENFKSNTEEPPFEKITFNTD